MASVSPASGSSLLSPCSHPFSGLLTALTQPTPDALRDAIRETRRLTSAPFGVNITILPAITPPDYAGYARAAVEEGVRIFETAGNQRACILRLCFRLDGLMTERRSWEAPAVPQGQWVCRAAQVHDHPAREGRTFAWQYAISL